MKIRVGVAGNVAPALFLYLKTAKTLRRERLIPKKMEG